MTFSDIARVASKLTGKPVAFLVACLFVIGWAALGPHFGWSDSHSLFVNTATTIVTFLLIFLVQNSQNRDGAAIQGKLDELIRASRASNRYIGLENLTDEDLERLRGECTSKAGIAPCLEAEPQPKAQEPMGWPWSVFGIR